MKKLLALLLAVCMLSVSLVACDLDDIIDDVKVEVEDKIDEIEKLTYEQVMKKAEEAFKASKFEVKMSMTYNCKDPVYAEQFSAVNSNVIYFVDGSEMRATVETMGTEINIAVVDNVVYYALPAQEIRFKAPVNQTQIKDFIEDMDMSFDSSDVSDEFVKYDSIDMVQDGDTYVITCTGISDEAVKEIVDNSGFASIDGKINDIKCVITVKDGKMEKMEISTVFDIQIPDVQGRTQIDFVSLIELKYTDIDPITVPEDANLYELKSYEEIFGK